MKKIKFAMLSALAFGLTLTSCGDDDSNSTNTSGSIVGKWTYNREADVVNNNEEWSNWPHTDGCSKDYVEFTETTIKDVTYFEGCEEEIEEGTYVKNGNKVTVRFGNETVEGQITELTSNTMKIKSTYTFEGETFTGIVEYKK